MQKTTGRAITDGEFRSLKPGDVYFITDQDELRTFERLAKCVAKKGVLKAVNSDGHVNPIADMRWPTYFELNGTEEQVAVAAPSYSQPTTRQPSTKESKSMHCPSAVSQCLSTVKCDATDAVWRTAARETVRSVHQPMSAFLASQNLPAGVASVLAAALKTDAGEAVLGFVLGNTMPYVPHFARNARLMRLSKELRVLGLEHFTTKLADAVLSPLRAQLTELVGGLPLDEE
jgi:hypothetical protein